MLKFTSGEKMTVYIEYAILDNLVIDYLILKATFTVLGLTRKKGRLFLCAFLGGVLSLLYPLLNLSNFYLTIFKLFSALFIVLLSGEFRSIKEFFICYVLFFLVTFLFGGSVSALLSFFNIEVASSICVSVVIIPVYFTYKIVVKGYWFFFRRKQTNNFNYLVKINLKSKSILANGFLDSGNSVYIDNSPVVFCSKRLAKIIFKTGEIFKVKQIEINTVNGNDKKVSFIVPEIEIITKDSNYKYYSVRFCVVDSLGLSIDLLLSPAHFGGSYGKECDKIKTQKIGVNI